MNYLVQPFSVNMGTVLVFHSGGKHEGAYGLEEDMIHTSIQWIRTKHSVLYDFHFTFFRLLKQKVRPRASL